jgi:hypothetical protein
VTKKKKKKKKKKKNLGKLQGRLLRHDSQFEQ